MTQRTSPAPASTVLAETGPVARPGRWTVDEAVGRLRRAIDHRDPTDHEAFDELVAWIRRDLDATADERDPDALYERVAASGRGEPSFLSGRPALVALGYGDLCDGLEPWIVDRFLGLGCPWTVGLPHEGATVVDLGSGSGVDLSIAARAVGPGGRAVGIELRDSLLHPELATRRSAPVVRGESRRCPLATGSASLIVANGLPTLMRLTTAATVLDEVTRLLEPGGSVRFTVLVTGPAGPADQLTDLEVINAVRTGKPVCQQYRQLMEAAGFVDISIELAPSPYAPGRRPGPVSAALVTGQLA